MKKQFLFVIGGFLMLSLTTNLSRANSQFELTGKLNKAPGKTNLGSNEKKEMDENCCTDFDYAYGYNVSQLTDANRLSFYFSSQINSKYVYLSVSVNNRQTKSIKGERNGNEWTWNLFRDPSNSKLFRTGDIVKYNFVYHHGGIGSYIPTAKQAYKVDYGCYYDEKDRVDPDDVSAKFLPDNNMTLMIIGQDYGSIEEYNAYDFPNDPNISSFPIPGGVTTYVNLYNLRNDEIGPLNGNVLFGGLGIDNNYNSAGSADWGAGEMNANKLTTNNSTSALVIGLSIAEGDDCFGNYPHPHEDGTLSGAIADISKGKWDAEIAKLAKFIADSKVPVFLRIGYEFDGRWNLGYQSTNNFKKAFRHIVERIDNIRYVNPETNKRAKDNVAYVWQSCSSSADDVGHAIWGGSQHEDITKWYPGDDYVDWMGVSYFAHGPSHKVKYQEPGKDPKIIDNLLSPKELRKEIYDFARHPEDYDIDADGDGTDDRKKIIPVMICESAPVGLDLDGGEKNIQLCKDGYYPEGGGSNILEQAILMSVITRLDGLDPIKDEEGNVIGWENKVEGEIINKKHIIGTCWCKPENGIGDTYFIHGGPVTAWYGPIFREIRDNNDIIRGLAYINANWEDQFVWNGENRLCTYRGKDPFNENPNDKNWRYANGYWGDSRVQVNEPIARYFYHSLTGEHVSFLHGGPYMFYHLEDWKYSNKSGTSGPVVKSVKSVQQEIDKKKKIYLAGDRLYVPWIENDTHYRVYSISGRLKQSGTNNTIYIGDWKPGVYIMVTEFNEQIKFIKQ